MAGIEDLDFRAHSERLHAPGHVREHRRSVGHDVVALAEVHRPAVEGAYLGQQLGDVGEPLLGARKVGARLRERQRPVRGAEREVATHAGGQVQHDIDPGVAHPLHHLAVERRIARRLPGLRIAHVHVDDRGAGPGRIDAGAGDLLRGHRHLVGTARGIARAGECAGDEGFAAGSERHGEPSCRDGGSIARSPACRYIEPSHSFDDPNPSNHRVKREPRTRQRGTRRPAPGQDSFTGPQYSVVDLIPPCQEADDDAGRGDAARAGEARRDPGRRAGAGYEIRVRGPSGPLSRCASRSPSGAPRWGRRRSGTGGSRARAVPPACRG